MTDDYTSELLRALGGRSRVRILQGTFVAATAAAVTVDIGSSRIPALLGTVFLPEVNEPVWVWNVDKQFFVMGPVAVKPDRGTVQSVSSGLATLSTAFGTVIAPYTGATPSAGQTMKLLWHGGPFAMLMSTSPAGGTPPPAGGGGTSAHVDEFPALDAGSYGSGRWWTPQVYASDQNLGAWFYGTKIQDTLPAAAAIQKVEVCVPGGTDISGSAPNFAVHAYTAKPGGSPALSAVGAAAIAPGWCDLKSVGVAIGNALRSGAGAYGIGLNHGGFNVFPSLAQDGFSGRLRITSVY